MKDFMTSRHNQDKYDVIQAQEEWDSMHMPRKALELIAELTARVDFLAEENAQLHAQIEELSEFKYMYEGLQ